MRWLRLMLFVLVFGGAGIVFFQIMSIKAGYEVDFLQKRLERLANERQNLLLKLGELTSIDRIQSYARKNGFDFLKKAVIINVENESEELMKAEAFTFSR